MASGRTPDEQAALKHLWMPTQNWADIAENGVDFIEEGRGVRIRDGRGRWGYDGVAGLMLVNVGHGRDEIADVVAAQLRTLGYASTFRYATGPVARFAAKVASLTPGDLNRVAFTSGGSEAVETALKIAYRYHTNRGEPGRVKVIARDNSYHGTSRGALSVSTSRYLDRPSYEPILPSTTRIAPQPLHYRGAEPGEDEDAFARRCAQAVEDIILAEGPETVSAVIAEPVSFSAAVAVPGPSYWPMLRQICERHGVLLIADEVITGFGRTGRWFGVEHWGVVPDIMTMAKGITSGYFPVGACVVRDEVFAAFQGGPDTTYRHGFTYGGHPAGGAAGLANVAIMEREGLVENSRVLGEHMLTRLRALMASHPTVGDVRGLGLMCAVDLVADRATKEPLIVRPEVLRHLNAGLSDAGLFTRATNAVYLAPPLSITRAELDEVVDIIDTALGATERAFGF
ncbi:MAG: aspartate aminotransferase family protein [Chloroflexota bacterium]